MPYFTFDDCTSSGTEWSTVSITANEMQFQYEEYVRECKRKEQLWAQWMMEEQQRMDEERQEQERIKEDKWRHPLFYLKEGIV